MSARDGDKLMTEANLARLLSAARPAASAGFEHKLARAVAAEVQAEGRRSSSISKRRRMWIVTAATISAVAAGTALFVNVRPAARPRVVPSFVPSPVPAPQMRELGQVEDVYGLVSLGEASAQPVASGDRVRSGERVRTQAGSGAQIVLADQSRLTLPPRAAVEINEDIDGPTVRLQEGFFRMHAAKQAAGRHISIMTPGSRITVLGTELDVHLVQKADGRKQTRVSVASGRVEMESSGAKAVLLPNMEGVADEGSPPITRSLTTEVNEMIRLLAENKRVAAESNLPAGSPAIVEFNGDASATVWMVVTGVRLAPGIGPIEAFTLQGARVPFDPASSAPTELILKCENVRGLFASADGGGFELNLPTDPQAGESLIQLRLPDAMCIDEISPKPLELSESLTRKIVTVAAQCRVSKLLEP